MAFYSVNIRNAIISGAIDALKIYNFGDAPEDFDPSYWEYYREKSHLGSPVFAPIEIKAGQYTDEDGSEKTFNGMFIDCVLTTVTQNKIIERTQITGRKGTIKEYVSDGDFDVSLKIVLYTPNPNLFPEEASNRLVQILKAPISLEVVSPVLNKYDIYNIVVTGYTNSQRQGFKNITVFDVTAVSDTPLQLQFKD